ncbi:MAG: DUF413 domain-containing protein [Proteobacteria bacterium]|nr:DUF413 domain-containing protein [Pseudomonadota bacterium]
MTTEARQAHLAYLGKTLVIFPEIGKALGHNDAASIRKYGCWYEALDKGTLPVMSEAQKHFVEAVHGKTAPTTQHETIWIEYKKLLAQSLMHATSGGQYSRAHGHYGNTNSSEYIP